MNAEETRLSTMSEQPVRPPSPRPPVEPSDQRQTTGVVLGSGGLVLAVAAVDYVTGFEISVSLLYLVPVSWSAWRAGRGAGVAVAGTSAFAWLVADMLSRSSLGPALVPVWNTLMLAGIFGIVAVLLAALKHGKENLEATVWQRTAALREEIAERRRAEEQLWQANAELQRTQMQLIEAAKMETVGRMAAGVAHEVKNPLMTLGMGADYFLQRQPANADEAALLQDMKDAVQRASNIINLMLDFSKPRPLKLAPENLNSIVEDSLRLVRHQLVRQRVEVERHLSPDLPLLPVDRTRFEQVLVNLYTNAAQAMTNGGTLTVRTTYQPASGASSGPPAHVSLEVEDTGPGVPPEYLSKVFEPFFTTKPPGQGTGLGLAIVHRIVQIHGGSVSLSNRPGGGARATLKFSFERQ
jgi:signal transduction histidine kinase